MSYRTGHPTVLSLATLWMHYRYGVSNLSRKYFIPLLVRDKPLFTTGCVTRGINSQTDGHKKPNNTPMVPYNSKKKVYLLIQYLWKKWVERIYDIRVVNTDSISYLQRSPDQCLQVSKKEEKVSIWRFSFSNTTISHPSFSLLVDSLGRKPRPPCPIASHQSGEKRTLEHADM